MGEPPVEVISWPTFEDAVKHLEKKYPHVRADIQTAASKRADIRAIPGFHNNLFKLRVASSDMKRGKSGGFRLIAYVAPEHAQQFYLITAYAKVEREDIEFRELMQTYSRFLTYLREQANK